MASRRHIIALLITCFVETPVGLASLHHSDLPCPSLVSPWIAAGSAGSVVSRKPVTVTVHGKSGG